jgi:uncharacterized protein (TIGR00251 family)
MVLSARIRVRVTTRAARDEVAGWQDGALRVRVSAPPVNGRANDAVARVIAKALGVPKSAVGIISGATGREKVVEIAGLSEAEVAARLAT